jgi:hypothetical protein
MNSATTTSGKKTLAMLFAAMCLSADKTKYLILCHPKKGHNDIEKPLN